MIQALIVFSAAALGDILWARYISHAAKGNRRGAAMWAAGMYLTGALVVVDYTANHWLLAPAVAGAFVGTAIGVRK